MAYSYDEFKDVILSKLSDYYSSDTNIYFRNILKNNGVRLDGLTIAYDDEERVNPLIYINDLYYKYCDDDLSIDEVVEKIIEIRERCYPSSKMQEAASFITNWDNISQCVFPALINTEANRDMLSDLVEKSFLDLSVVYYIRIPGDMYNDRASCKITKSMLSCYGISEEELHQQALDNLCNRDYFQVRSIYTLIGKIIDMDLPARTENEPDMLVLSNGSDIYGAAQLLNIGRLKEEYGTRSFFVIPSSIHEAILIDYDENVDTDQLNQMVREVNGSSLAATEVLSDHVYFYNGATCELEMCA